MGCRYSRYIQRVEVIDLIPNTEQLRTAFNNKLKKNIPQEPIQEEPTISFWDAFTEFVRECGIQNNWTDATYEKFAATKKHLEDFDINLTFEALTENKLTEYVNYLRDTKNLRNSTIGKQIGFLKWFLRWGRKKKSFFLHGRSLLNCENTTFPKQRNTLIEFEICFCFSVLPDFGIPMCSI